MLDQLRSIAIFYQTVKLGSFRAAAAHVKLSPSVVSHHISQLEEALGVTLLYRTTRKLSLTHQGQMLYDAAIKMVVAAEDGLNAIIPQSKQPSGELTLNVPSILIRSSLSNCLVEFSNTYPKIQLNCHYSDQVHDMFANNADMSIRIGKLTESSLKARKIFSIERKLVIAPKLLKTFQKIPQHPQQLIDWPWIDLQMLSPTRELKNNQGKKVLVHFQAKICVDSVDAACQLAIAGGGIASPPTFLVEEQLKLGHLVELVPEWRQSNLDVYMMWPANIKKSSLTLIFKEFVVKYYS